MTHALAAWQGLGVGEAMTASRSKSLDPARYDGGLAGPTRWGDDDDLASLGLCPHALAAKRLRRGGGEYDPEI